MTPTDTQRAEAREAIEERARERDRRDSPEALVQQAVAQRQPAAAPELGANIAAAVVAFQGEMPKVHKGKTAKVETRGGGSYSYTYADLADVSAAATPILARHGLAFMTRPVRTERGLELVGVLLHQSGETITAVLPLSGSTEQQLGSSLTYGRRYLLGCLTGIVTDDDDDGAHTGPRGFGGDTYGGGHPTADLTVPAEKLWKRARRAADVDAVRKLWGYAAEDGLLDVLVSDDRDQEPSTLRERLTQLVSTMQAFDQPATEPGEQEGEGAGGSTPPPDEGASSPPAPRRPNADQFRMLMALLAKADPALTTDKGRPRRIALLTDLVGRDLKSARDITGAEMHPLLDMLKRLDDDGKLGELVK